MSYFLCSRLYIIATIPSVAQHGSALHTCDLNCAKSVRTHDAGVWEFNFISIKSGT